MRILVVDDNKILVETLYKFFSGLGHKTFTALSGSEALQVLDLFPPIHLVVTDYNLPDFNGKELLTRVRRRFPAMPVYLITGLDIEDEDFTACLMKPINLSRLLNLMSTIQN